MLYSNYGMYKDLELDFDRAVAKFKNLAAKNGIQIEYITNFGERIKKETGTEIPPYLIFRLSDPEIELKLLKIEPEIGLLLPINAIIYQTQDGKVRCSVLNVTGTLGPQDDVRLAPYAVQIEKKLLNLLNEL